MKTAAASLLYKLGPHRIDSGERPKSITQTEDSGTSLSIALLSVERYLCLELVHVVARDRREWITG